jgi:toxin FitB
MKYLLDTNVFSELKKGPRGDQAVRTWFDRVDDGALFTSVLVLGELRRGIENLKRRDPVAAAALEQWLLRLTEQFSARILSVDAVVSDLWGRLNVPDPMPTVDGLLAATALAHDLTLVTRNTADVRRSGVKAVNPFETAPCT